MIALCMASNLVGPQPGEVKKVMNLGSEKE